MPTCYHVGMFIADVAYDLTVGVIGAVIGAFVIGFISRRVTRRLRGQIVINERDLDGLRLENNKLLMTIKERENQILELQKKILNKKSQK